MKTIVIGVIGADVHAVGNKIIEYVLKNEGYNVVNVGVLSSQEDFINAAVESNADMILVSSLYGHGEIDCMGLRQKCDEAGLVGIPLFVGGCVLVVIAKEYPIIFLRLLEECYFCGKIFSIALL